MKKMFCLFLVFLFACTTAEKINKHPQKPQQSKKNPLLPNREKVTATDLLNNDPWLKLKSSIAAKDWHSVLATTEQLSQQQGLMPAQKTEIMQAKVLSFESLNQSAELERLASETEDKSVKSQIYYKLGQSSLETRDQDSARSFFARAYNADPNSEAGRQSQELLAQLEAARRVEAKTIGVVLPMSGRFSSISQKTLRGVQMGLGLYGNSISSFKLAVVDSEGNPDTARKGVERLVKEDGVISIIGSVLSKTASAVASKGAELGVPTIALSQKSGITDSGKNIYRNSLTSDMQVRHLVKYAIEELGLKRFAVLYPNDLYGVEYVNIFWDEVLARGGQITSVQSYSPKETDFRYVIQRLVGTFYIEDRADEYNLRMKAWTEQQSKKSAKNQEPPEDILPPIVDFDAVFIPDSAKSLGQIAAMLTFNNVQGVKLLGTNLWNVPGLGKRAGAFAKDIYFVDSFVANSTQFQNSQFVKEYRALFSEDPGAFELQGYDSALLLRQLIASGYSSREGISSALNSLQDFPGAIGPLSMTPDHEILRPLQILSLTNGEPAPLIRSIK